MLDPRRLLLLGSVGRAGSIAGAASVLDRTAAAVSQQLLLLEREAGLPLLERGPRSVRLTPAGRRLAERAEEVAALLAGAERELREFGTLEAGELTIGTFPTAAAAILPGALAAFARVHPGVDVRLVEAEPDELEPLVAAGTVDVAIVYRYALAPRERPIARSIRTVELLAEPVLVALPAALAGVLTDPVPIGSLAAERWITSRDGTAGAESLRRAAASAGFEPDVRVRSNDYLVVQALVGAGAGVALVPRIAVRRTRGVVVRHVDAPGLTRSIDLLVHRSSGNPALEPMVATIVASAT
jgi:DNA-binding transcriptional LysR family regulator